MFESRGAVSDLHMAHLRQWLHQDGSLLQIPLVRELAFVLVLKLVLILSIRAVFFSDPVALDEPHTDIARQLGVCTSDADCSGANPVPHSVTNASQQEDLDDQ